MDDFMNYTKIKVKLDIIDINMLLSEVLESFSLIFKINNVDLINKVTDDEIYINGDYDRLKQVFINLIKNGIESFDGKNGKLEIKSKENNKEVIIVIQHSKEFSFILFKESFSFSMIKTCCSGVDWICSYSI